MTDEVAISKEEAEKIAKEEVEDDDDFEDAFEEEGAS